MNLLEIIFIVSSLVFILFYLFYGIFVIRHSHSNKSILKDENPLQSVSLIICAYNEEKSILQKIENTLKIKYPIEKLEVIVFDNGSNDATLEIAQKFENRGVKVYSLNSENRGKSAGLNVVFKLAKNEIVAITDVDCQLKDNVLLESMPYFNDVKVGAVCGSQILLNPEESESTQMEESLQGFYKMMRKAESNVDSTIVYNGEFLAFRKHLIEELDEEVGADDTQIAVRIRQSGHRALFLEEANFYEFAPKTLKTRWKQKIRRSSQVVQAIIKYRNLMFKSSEPYNCIIYPWNFFMHVVSPFFFVSVVALGVIVAVVNPLFLGFVLVVSAVFLLVCVLALQIMHKSGLKVIFSALLMFLDAQITLFLGFWIQLRKKPYKWEPLDNTRRY